MSAHSILPPSGAGIWGAPFGCTGWVQMSQRFPETEQSPEAAEGDAAHELGAFLLEARGAMPRGMVVDTPSSNGVMYVDEMYDAAEVYAEHVLGVLAKASPGAIFGVEAKIKAASSIHSESWGTSDAYLIDKPQNAIDIWDFKYGHSVVEAFENWQGTNYAAGIKDTFKIGYNPTVRIHIVQPRAFHREGIIRTWTTTMVALQCGAFPWLKKQATKALGSDAEALSGPHCRYCPGRHACKAALEGGVQLFEASSRPVPVELTPEALGVQLAIIKRARKHLEYLESGYDEQVRGIITAGKVVPHWSLQSGVGREVWTVPPDDVVSMGDMMGVDLRKAVAVNTPKQARTAGIDAAIIRQYSQQQRTGLILVPDDGTQARKVFAQ